MINKRIGKKAAIFSFVEPFVIYITLATLLLMLSYDALLSLKGGLLVGVTFVGIWRYGLLFTNYIRALIYAKIVYPTYKQNIEKLKYKDRFPDTIYFIIPSYKEDAWVTTEVFQSLISDINSIPSKAVLLISTATDYENAIIRNVFNAHSNADKIKLIFQKQNSGKRIAMGHALRALSRECSKYEEDKDSVTIFMDGDTYIPLGTLKDSIPFFKILKKLGALTTNEIGFIHSNSTWYKEWFNLKFAQRHILFQSHSLSKRVLTLTGRFSMFRTDVVIQEDFISLIENDIITNPDFGKFRFLMGDDKSSWYYMMKHGWDLLYLPDVVAYSLESRDGSFLEISRTLPYRWYGNTLRNNKRARALKNQPFFIKYLFYDQLALMWTSLIGITTVLVLSIFKSGFYLILYASWIIYVRTFQMGVFAFSGHRVSLKTLPLMLYGQWYGAIIKIRAYFNLADQKWSKGGDEVQSGDDNFAPIKFRFFKYYAPFRMYLFISLFMFFILSIYTNLLAIPSLKIFTAKGLKNDNLIVSKIVTNDTKDDARELNKEINEAPPYSTISLPSGIIDIFEPIVINRSDITIIGDDTTILSHMKDAQKAIIIIDGKKGNYIGTTKESLKNKSKITLDIKTKLKRGDILLIEQENDMKFVKDILLSQKWYKKYPTLRSEIVEVSNYENNKLLMKFISSSPIDKGAKIFKIKPLKNIMIKNLTITSVFDSKQYKYIYKNIKPNLKIDSIFMQYVSNVNLEHIKIYNSGSNPLVLQRAYNCDIKDIEIDGAINKGKGGNGYLRINKSFHNYLKNIKVKNIRHIVFQWASAYNSIDGLYSEVDVNFHGGASHDNIVKNALFRVDLKQHKWGEVYNTPKNASWAPPDLKNNIVIKVK
jgi:glycosyltransferase Alg8